MTKKSRIWPEQVRKVRTGKVAPYTAMIISIMLIVVGLIIVIDSPQTGQIENNIGDPRVRSSSTQYEITWIITDEFAPDPRYTVTVNGSAKVGHDDQIWSSGVPIVVDVMGHFPGEYKYTIYVADGAGGVTYDTVMVFANTNATINSPPDVVYDSDFKLVFYLNETLDFTIPEYTTYNFESISAGVIEFVFKPVGTITNDAIFTGAWIAMSLTASYGTLTALFGTGSGFGNIPLLANQIYTIRIDFTSRTAKWWVNGTLDAEDPGFPDEMLPMDHINLGIGHSMIVYEFNVWRMN